MKHLLLSLCIFILRQQPLAQNVGIGTTTPAFKLDVKNGSINTDSVYRIGSVSFLDAKGGNVLVGAGDRVNMATGNSNIALGPALQGAATGFHNIAIGYSALNNLTGFPSDNVAIGGQALEFNKGSGNVAIGRSALSKNTTAYANTAVGNFALGTNTVGVENTAVGSSALSNNYSGSSNTAVGSGALSSNIGGANTATGASALSSNTFGGTNSAFGFKALNQNTEGSSNTAMGSVALYDNTTGTYNTGIGVQALGANTTGSHNTALGHAALKDALTTSSNTAVGASALIFTKGSHNTGVGTHALYQNTFSQFNTGVGFNACANFTSGWNNTAVGAEADISFNGQYNAIAIGNLAKATDNSKVRIGNSSNWSYEAFANWTNISDGRYKKNIQENVAGLDFIMKLRPVNYQMDVAGLSKKFGEDKGREADQSMKAAIAEKEQMLWTGFIAQEVEAAAKETNFTFSGIDKPRNEYGVYGLRYAEFVVPLVKGMQQQQGIIEELKKQNEELKTRLDKLEKMIAMK